MTSTPKEYHRQMASAQFPGWEVFRPEQIHYQWTRLSSGRWRLHADPFESANSLLRLHHEKYSLVVLHDGNMQALAFFPKRLTPAVIRKVKEMVMDATHSTNSDGMPLFSREVNGSDCPLGCCFTDIIPPQYDHFEEAKLIDGMETCWRTPLNQRLRDHRGQCSCDGKQQPGLQNAPSPFCLRRPRKGWKWALF
ncbi:hypothetical protein K470DRAFT_253942 [Piedraia hortae CBS 480.64]|uniref:Uncharacterized protein n=1 Tax=Piedraia hortae CBS 480.64 TaxID=1314780 RepID=A0A6A7CCN7_9PEZI|nr:hypothetical protein K470DRAFT_253942 [Piedraia hortae CBS 480.64]